ncbi:DUF2271 domain-containing protein [Roseomonas sp. F4]
MLPALAAASIATPAVAAELRIGIELPRISVAEYHRPYVASWVERPDQTAVATLAVWYDTKLRNERGQTWLRDLTQWWRRAGRGMALPADGVSGATRAPGRHELRVDADSPVLAAMPPGEYRLVVEAAREGGGREQVRVPFQWPPSAQDATANGSAELGAVTLGIRP